MSFFRRIPAILLTAFFIMIVLSPAACTDKPSITLTQSDEVAIYSAVAHQVYNRTTFYGTYQPPTLYIIRYTDNRAGDLEAKPSEPILISEQAQSAISATLGYLPTEIVWVNSSADVEKDSYGTVLNGGAIVTLGNIHLKADDSIQVPGSYFMAGDGAGGETYILKCIEGEWVVTGTTGATWIS